MKEQITLRLYDRPGQVACSEADRYCPSDDVCGWDYGRGDQIGLHEHGGGFLMAGIDYVDPTVHQDRTGRYKIAVAWTLD